MQMYLDCASVGRFKFVKYPNLCLHILIVSHKLVICSSKLCCRRGLQNHNHFLCINNNNDWNNEINPIPSSEEHSVLKLPPSICFIICYEINCLNTKIIKRHSVFAKQNSSNKSVLKCTFLVWVWSSQRNIFTHCKGQSIFSLLIYDVLSASSHESFGQSFNKRKILLMIIFF